MGETLQVNGEMIELDGDGHLQTAVQWTPAFANALARRDGMVLDEDHWWLIDFVRSYHARYTTPPLMRVVVAALRARRNDESVGSRDVYRLFSDHPIRQACRYGGLPKPDWCI